MKPMYSLQYNALCLNLKQVPAVADCFIDKNVEDGFIVQVKFKDGHLFMLKVFLLARAYPSIISSLNITSSQEEHDYYVVMAPYISAESAKICEQQQFGYMDFSGNCRLLFHSLYLKIEGKPNAHSEKRALQSIFDPRSSVSSAILREIMSDTTKRWRLKHLSEKLNCSIGQVSKVKNYLEEQLWAKMGPDGIEVTQGSAIMNAWSEAYSKKEVFAEKIECYTLLPLSDFEEQLQQISRNSDIDIYLTGFSGGVRYAPVVRYNKVHLIITADQLSSFLHVAPCTQVDSGANVHIYVSTQKEILFDARTIHGVQVASPVQVFLDCMKLFGRGEELAQAILTKEIEK